MRTKPDIWKTDRLPTRNERIVGVVAAIFVTFAFVIFAAFAVDSESYLVAAAFLIVALLTFQIGYRAIFGDPKLPEPGAVKAVNYFMILSGLCLLLASPFAPSPSESLFGVSVGLTGIWAGFYNLKSTYE